MEAKPVEMTESEYEDYLNECFETVTICGMTYDQGSALRQLDPIAFRCGLADMDTEKWECGYCGERFDDETSAEECCVDVDTDPELDGEESEEVKS